MSATEETAVKPALEKADDLASEPAVQSAHGETQEDEYAFGQEQRIRTLTEKGAASYETTLLEHKRRIYAVHEKARLEINIYRAGQIQSNPDTIQESLKTLKELSNKYQSLANSLLTWLEDVRTADSLREYGFERDNTRIFIFEMEEVLAQMNKQLQMSIVPEQRLLAPSIHSDRRQSGYVRSHGGQSKHESGRHSRNTANTARSTTESLLLRKQVEAEAAKASLQFAEREAELKRKQTELEIERGKLNRQRKVEMIDAECDTIRKFGSEERSSEASEENIRDRTVQFVKDQDKYVLERREHAVNVAYVDLTPDSFPPSARRYENTDLKTVNKTVKIDASAKHETNNRVKTMNNESMPVNELSRFLLKKDMLLSRFTRFNDRPESFHTWKKSFTSITEELQVTPFEESDLLVKWLGPKSSAVAQTIRSSNINDPAMGVRKIWDGLEECYGRPEMVDSSLRKRLEHFPKITVKDLNKLYELHDLLAEISSLMTDPKMKLLAYFDTSAGINPIISKLPQMIKGKWRDKAFNFKQNNDAVYPPFSFFLTFIHDMARRYTDPGFDFEVSPSQPQHDYQQKTRVSAKKTDVDKRPEDNTSMKCIVHSSNHALKDCRVFKSKPIEERRKILKDNGVCFRCCNTKDHMRQECKAEIVCNECGSQYHSSPMHVAPLPPRLSNSGSRNYGGEQRRSGARNHGGEQRGPQGYQQGTGQNAVTNSCTEICAGEFGGKSCAKILPVYVTHRDNPSARMKTYAILDEQSNKTLAKEELFDYFGVNCRPEEYTLMSCSGKTVMTGRKADGFTVESLDGTASMQLPTLIECGEIPSNRNEIPTPDVARYHHHLYDVADQIEPVDDRADILLLIGRDLMEAHHIQEQRVGAPSAPYAQKLKLGWVVVGEVCLGKSHATDTVSACRTYVQHNGRPTLLKPCPNGFIVKDKLTPMVDDIESIASNVFQLTEDDNKIGRSVEDKVFLKIMQNDFHKDEKGHWCAPLPFKTGKATLPNNRPMALKRATSLTKSLLTDENKRTHFTDFMQKLLDNGHAEVAPPLSEGQERWYLPVFGVYHPKKPGQIRCVFDSSAKYENQSLNSVLLSGPDLNNSLLGVLLRFRKNEVAVSTDIRQMFYSFTVREDHRDYLRFLWHRDNDIAKDLIDYRMNVHVFGNSPSPSVAIYGLHQTAESAEPEYGSDMKEFVQRNFYVDDGLASLPTSDQAVDLLKRTQKALSKHGNLHLHKFASNDENVMAALPSEDLAENLKNLDLKDENLPLQRSLGLYWDLVQDRFTYHATYKDKQFTRRGVLSVVNSIYDPLGFVAPITVQGKLLLRKFLSKTTDWDEPLPEECKSEWDSWCSSLEELQTIQVPRMFVPASLTQVKRTELHVFSDASEKVIAAVCYLRTEEEDTSSKVGFVLGKAKVAPMTGHTIPRLELCAAVLAVEVAELVVRNLDEKLDEVNFYSDSKVVLGYINNETRRFYVYVENRVERIRKATLPEQWNFVPTALNSADHATRPMTTDSLFIPGGWLAGPKEYLDRAAAARTKSEASNDCFTLMTPEEDKEVRPVLVKKTHVEKQSLGSHRFQRFSRWRSLVRAISVLQHFLNLRSDVDVGAERKINSAEQTIIKCVQKEAYAREIECIQQKKAVPRDSQILNLNPQLDKDELLRVGGRLNKSTLCIQEKNPIILPGKHHISLLIVRHFHESVKHQGRHFTEGSVRSGGFWITGVKRLISSVIHSCVPCKKLRGKVAVQQMADLPQDRLDVNPPFTNVGVDTFGPWYIVTRRTRGGAASSKRWAILFTCLSTRAIHIEVIEEMTSSAFINALRRFQATRGKVKIFRSDRGTNFVGATDDLGIDRVNIEDDKMKPYLYNSGTKWIFNPPCASHMGGAWERLIGVTRRILESILSDISGKHLTHDVLITFMAEVCAIVNNRPITSVSTDPENPFVLSPAMILTQKLDSDRVHCDEQNIDTKDLLRAEWKRVCVLSDTFWSRWRKEYIQSLQGRRKWTDVVPDLEEGMVVLLRDKSCCRNEWPLGRIVKTFKSDDDKVRTVQVLIAKDGAKNVFTRPITEIIPLV